MVCVYTTCKVCIHWCKLCNAIYWQMDTGSNTQIQLLFSQYTEHLNWLLVHYFSEIQIQNFGGNWCVLGNLPSPHPQVDRTMSRCKPITIPWTSLLVSYAQHLIINYKSCNLVTQMKWAVSITSKNKLSITQPYSGPEKAPYMVFTHIPFSW